MKRALTWAGVGLAITTVTIAVFVLATAVFPGDPGQFYLFLCLSCLGLLIILRALRVRSD